MRTIIIVLLTSCVAITYAQLYDAQWALGNNESVLDFRTTDTVEIYSLPTIEYFALTSASICDEEGSLLYYTNGISICGKDSILQNGSGLSPCAYTDLWSANGLDLTQAALFIPQPGNSRYYYLFHFSNDALNNTRPGTIYYSIIDKEGNDGQGAVLSKNVPIVRNVVLRGGGMTACKHANGRDYWLIMGGSNNNEFYKFLITPDGVSDPDTVFIGCVFPVGYDVAYSKFSQDGSKYATGIFSGAPILVMDFDRCRGEFSNPITLNQLTDIFTIQDSLQGCYAVEFSPNGEFLYVSNPHSLVQYDLWSANAQDSIPIFTGDSSDYYSINMLQVAPNGKLYAGTWNGGLEALHVVNYPDLAGDSAGFVYGGQQTLTQNSNNLPNLINYKLGPLLGSGCDTIRTDTTGVGIIGLGGNDLLRLMPDPADKYVYVEMGMQGGYEFDLLNLTGQVLATKQTPQVDIFDTEQLAGGVYFVRVIDKITGAEITAKKLVVVH